MQHIQSWKRIKYVCIVENTFITVFDTVAVAPRKPPTHPLHITPNDDDCDGIEHKPHRLNAGALHPIWYSNTSRSIEREKEVKRIYLCSGAPVMYDHTFTQLPTTNGCVRLHTASIVCECICVAPHNYTEQAKRIYESARESDVMFNGNGKDRR